MEKYEHRILKQEWLDTAYDLNGISGECLKYVSDAVSQKNENGERKNENDQMIIKNFLGPSFVYDSIVSNNFINRLKRAVEQAEGNRDEQRTESLNTILDVAKELRRKFERERESEVIRSIRYKSVNGKKVEVTTEELLNQIDIFLKEIDMEASAGFRVNGTIYTFLTDAKDKDDFIRRMETVSLKLSEYEKNKSPNSLEYIKEGFEVAKKDFESGDILGLDQKVTDGR